MPEECFAYRAVIRRLNRNNIEALSNESRLNSIKNKHTESIAWQYIYSPLPVKKNCTRKEC